MARLTRIEAQNLKGRSFSHELPARLAIIGPNFSGKTARIEAIRLALIGYIPEIGKRASATWELASGAFMRVAATYDNGHVIERRFDNGKALDDVTTCDLPLLNAEHYFGLTDKERVAYVFDRVKLPDSYTPESIIAEVERLSLEEKHSEEVEKAKGEFVATLRECFKGGTIQESLTNAVARFKSAFTYWNARAKETVGAVRLLTELKNREGEVTAETMAGLDAELKAAQAVVDDLNLKRGEAKEAERTRVFNEARLATLKHLLSEPIVDYPRMIEKEREKIGAITLEPVPSKEEIDKATKEHAAILSELEFAKGQLAGRKALILDVNRQVVGLAGLECCPFCHSKGKDWKDNLHDELERSLTEATSGATALTDTINDLSNKESGLAKWITDARITADSNTAKQRQIEKHEAAIRQHEADQKHQQERDEEARAEIARLDAVCLPLGDIDLEAEHAEASAKVKELLDRKQKAVQLQQDLRRAAEAQLEHLDAAAHLLVVKAVGKIIADKRDNMIADVFESLITTANNVIGALPLTLDFHEGEVGKWAGVKFVPHRVFSGVEKAITYVAIAAALSAQSPLRLLMLDELGRMTPKVRARILRSISEAVDADIIDQAIVVIPSDEPIVLDTFNVLFLGGEARG